MRPDLGLLDALALAVILFGAWCGVVAIAAAAAGILGRLTGRGRRPSIFDGGPGQKVRR